jgi:hypothetical protein
MTVDECDFRDGPKEPTMNEDLIIGPAVCFMFSWIAWVIFHTIRRSKTAKLQAGVQTKLLEKFGSSEDLLAYMQTDAGKHFLESFAIEQGAPYGRILGAAQAGVIATLFGCALLFLRGRVAGAEEGFLVFGTLILTLGVGFGVSASVSYALSKSFGLFGQRMAHRQ